MNRAARWLGARPRWCIAAIVLAIFAGVFTALNGLRFAPMRDEVHLWPTCLRFAHQFPPSLDTLRNYRELNTPLTYVVFGGLEHGFGGGIAVARSFNFLTALILALVIALADPNLSRGWSWRGPASCAGLLLFPYFLGTGVLIYSDMIAAALVVAGLALHLRGRPWMGMILFVLSISARQYAVAFPAALVGHEAWKSIVTRARNDQPQLRRSSARWIAPLLAIASLAGWFVFFGGPSPRDGILASDPANARPDRLFPAHSLYFLTCLGAYFVLPEALLFRTISPWLAGIRSRLSLILGAAVIVGFVIVPPLHNVEYNIPTMGYLDKAARIVFSDSLRMTAFAVLALLAVCRLSRVDLAFFLVWANVLMMLKTQVGWDKYALPLLAALWWLQSRGSPNEGLGPSRSN